MVFFFDDEQHHKVATMEDITRPEVCVFNSEASALIVEWGKTAIAYEIATEKVVELMMEIYSSRRQMELGGNEQINFSYARN